jgi:hypothetical protein
MSGKFKPLEENPVPSPSPSNPSSGSESGSQDVIKESLAINSLSTIAASASISLANLYQHQVNHARRLDSIAEATLGKLLLDFVTPDPVEVLSIGKLFKGEADSSIASVLTQLSAGQQATKIAQSTPGDIAMEIQKLGATVASLQGLVSQLTNFLKGSAN